jgi:peptidoglycan/xylan/chitin deacetylase (PgdA/CDA1 family)
MEADSVALILLYHKLGRPPRGAKVAGQYVSAGLFRRQLCYLRHHGYESISLLDLVKPGTLVPPKAVAITFDDGHLSVYEHAFPALAEYGFQATVFLVAGALGGSDFERESGRDVEGPLLGLSELREMQSAGIQSGSHTLTHPHLTALPPVRAQQEITESRARIEDALGASCVSFAYPYGDWNERVRELVQEAGYEAACTTVRAAARRGGDPLALPRINIRRYNEIPRFAYKLWRAGRTSS